MASIKDYEQNLERINHELEQNTKVKLALREKIQDMADEIQEMKEENADKKDIGEAKRNLDKMHKQKDQVSSNYYWLLNQKKICEESIAFLKKKEGIEQ